MYKISIVVFFLFSFALLRGQEIITKANNVVVENKTYGKGLLTIYTKKNKLIAGKTCGFQDKSVEQLFCDFFNARNQKDFLKFFDSENIPETYTAKDFLNNKSMYFEDSKNNYYEFDSKYILERDSNTKDVFIKYINHNIDFPKPIYSIFYLRKINGKYVISDLGQNFEIGLFLISTNSSVLNDFFLGKFTNEQLMVISPYVQNKTLNLKLIMDDYFKLMKENKNHPLYKLLYDDKYSIF